MRPLIPETNKTIYSGQVLFIFFSTSSVQVRLPVRGALVNAGKQC